MIIYTPGSILLFKRCCLCCHLGIFFVMFALLCNLADVMMAPFIGIMYLVLGTKGQLGSTPTTRSEM